MFANNFNKCIEESDLYHCKWFMSAYISWLHWFRINCFINSLILFTTSFWLFRWILFSFLMMKTMKHFFYELFIIWIKFYITSLISGNWNATTFSYYRYSKGFLSFLNFSFYYEFHLLRGLRVQSIHPNMFPKIYRDVVSRLPSNDCYRDISVDKTFKSCPKYYNHIIDSEFVFSKITSFSIQSYSIIK